MSSLVLSRPIVAREAMAARPRRAPLAVCALLAIVPAVALAVVMVLAASLIGPFVMFALPLMLCFGFALGPLHALVRGDLR